MRFANGYYILLHTTSVSGVKNLDSQLKLEILSIVRFENLSYRFELPLILGEWIRLFQRYKFASEVKNLSLSFPAPTTQLHNSEVEIV